MRDCDLFSAAAGDFVDVPAWQSQLGLLKARLTPAISDELESAVQMRQQLRGFAADLDRLHALLNLQFDRRLDQQAQVTSLALKAQRAQRMADVDSLTALTNRRYFLRRLARALAYAKPRSRKLAVMFLDINDFKLVNDQHGHDAGDKMLRIAAKRLSRCLRRDDVVSRLGGDEFACLLGNGADRDNVRKVAGKLLEAVSIPVKIGNRQLAIHPSVGIALFPGDGMTPSMLLKHADSAMFYAKKNGTGSAFFDACSPCPTDDALHG